MQPGRHIIPPKRHDYLPMLVGSAGSVKVLAMQVRCRPGLNAQANKMRASARLRVTWRLCRPDPRGGSLLSVPWRAGVQAGVPSA